LEGTKIRVETAAMTDQAYSVLYTNWIV